MAPGKLNITNTLNLEAMKTKILHITGTSVLIGSFLLITLSVFGQSRPSGSRDNKAPVSRTPNTVQTNNGNTRQERTVVRSSQSTNQSNRYTYTQKKQESKPQAKSNDNHGNNKSWGNDNSHNNKSWSKNNHNSSWSKNYHNNSWSSKNHSKYHHPKTYSTWNFPAPWKYASKAIVFRHNHGDYYFYNTRFYRYDPFRGYYVVNFPNGVVFTYLPFGCNEVMINGRIYYRYGDVYFEYTPIGYRMINPPNAIYFSVNF